MSVIPILTFENPILREKCEPVESLDQAAPVMCDLLDTLSKHANGVGLAAPQIGHLLRVVVIRPPGHHVMQFMINPDVYWHDNSKESEREGCLSYPDFTAYIARYRYVKVKYLDHRWQWQSKTFKRFEARIVQHEIDHLNGICLVGDAWREADNRNIWTD